MTAVEVDVFPIETTAYNPLYQHRRWLFVVKTNLKKHTDTTKATHNIASMLD